MAMAIVVILLRFWLLTELKWRVRQPRVLLHYRSVYSRSGRRNRVGI
jgi:hypothetical protein